MDISKCVPCIGVKRLVHGAKGPRFINTKFQILNSKNGRFRNMRIITKIEGKVNGNKKVLRCKTVIG